MSKTDEPVWDGGGSYHVIAWANGQKVLAFEEFGSYQGEWLMFTKDAPLPLLDGVPHPREPTYYVYKDWYGSCSGCDNFQAEDEGRWTLSKAKEFAAKYKSFIEIPRSTMLNLIETGGLRRLFPANIRDDEGRSNDDIDFDSFVTDAIVAVKLEENLDISAGDILCCRNQETKQLALRRFGYERFVAEANMTTLDDDGDGNKLIGCADVIFASVKDSSTDRRYLLRVPPQMKRLKEAIAWTFGMTENDYSPLVET